MTTDTHNTWYSSTVFHGDKAGRQIGFPTINLEPSIIPSGTDRGVYASLVKVAGKQYQGALYFGPRTVKNEVVDVLEIFILDFSEEIYGQTIQFQLDKFIRPVIHFATFEALKQQLHKDISDVRTAGEKNDR